MPGQRDHDLGLRKLARRLRKESTEAEQRLWRLLRDRRLSAHKFRRQVPLAGYILDFYCVKAKLAVEIDGSQHEKPEAIEYDAERTAVLNNRYQGYPL